MRRSPALEKPENGEHAHLLGRELVLRRRGVGLAEAVVVDPFNGLGPAEDGLGERAIGQVQLVELAGQLDELHQALVLLDAPLLRLQLGGGPEHQVMIGRRVPPPEELQAP